MTSVRPAAAFTKPATHSVGGSIPALTFIACLAFALGVAGSASASPQIAAICDQAARTAARSTGVPLAVLQAITRTETGHKRGGAFLPWPWTVNMEGKGTWFDSEDEARSYVFRHFKRGARSFDVGCFQINYKWHGQAFRSIDEMFDPDANARYAAKFLLKLYAETGNWSDAAGAYHSRTPKFATIYKARFNRFHSRLSKADTAPAPANQTPPPRKVAITRINTFPLLQAGNGTAVMGSLVKLGQTGAASPLFARSNQHGG